MRGMVVDPEEQAPTVYSFGETELAVRRLGIVSRIFDPASEAFISEIVSVCPRVALDLGCGPGFTTRLLSRVANPGRVVGVDRSERILERARAIAGESEVYVAGDVTGTPLSLGDEGERPDLIYLRMLASHLPQPEREISGWLGELKPGGLLLVEEVEGIDTGIETFERYLRIVAEMLEHHGNELYVGPRLAAGSWDEVGSIEVNRAVEISPDPALAARMFRMNLQSWRHDPYIQATCSPGELDRLAGELEELAEEPSSGGITWRLRQISLRRSDGDALI